MSKPARFLVVCAVGSVAFASCSSDDAAVAPAHAYDAGAGDVSQEGAAGQIGMDTGPACPTGQACGDGGVCAGGVCCPADLACGDACCTAGQVCSFLTCQTPGATCTDSSECPDDQYCEYGLGEEVDAGTSEAGTDAGSCQGGTGGPLLTGKCLARPPLCPEGDAGAPDGGPITCLEKCEYHYPPSDFTLNLKYTWGDDSQIPSPSDIMMTPVVINLDDDDCDGKVTERDIPEIAFATFAGGTYTTVGSLHVLSTVGGGLVEKWTLPGAVHGSAGMAAGDIDADGVPELVVCDPAVTGSEHNSGVSAYKVVAGSLTLLWNQSDTTKVHCAYESPAIADPGGTGKPVVLVGLTILDGTTGNVIRELDPATGAGLRLTGFADVDDDGTLDVVEGQRAWKFDGTLLWDLRSGANAISQGYHGIGDLDRDGKPEVVVISPSDHLAHVLQFDAAGAPGAQVKVVRRDVDINNGISTATFCGATYEYGGGAPTIADVDGDGYPDVGTAGAVGYVELSGKSLMDTNVANDATVLWFKETHDCSSAVTGSAVFDFNGDGTAEVVYGDEYHLWIYDGKTGDNLIPETCATNGTLWNYPVIVDVDNDGQAEVIVGSNNYSGLECNGTKQTGIDIYGAAQGRWVRTRRIWNQNTYHVTNVNEDGTIPAHEVANWKQPGLNNYRQNKQPGGEFSAPDAIVSVAPTCAPQYTLVATVRNMGEAVLPAGCTVTFYAGNAPSGTKLGEALTKVALYSAQSEVVKLAVADPNVAKGTVYATVQPPSGVQECRADNNTSPVVSGACSTGPK